MAGKTGEVHPAQKLIPVDFTQEAVVNFTMPDTVRAGQPVTFDAAYTQLPVRKHVRTLGLPRQMRYQWPLRLAWLPPSQQLFRLYEPAVQWPQPLRGQSLHKPPADYPVYLRVVISLFWHTTLP
jgi:hypothetical protein